jgi:hypothetical protein
MILVSYVYLRQDLIPQEGSGPYLKAFLQMLLSDDGEI